jgi:hypothetical protein
MKRFRSVLFLLACAGLGAALGAAEPSVLAKLPPERFARAGLQKLTAAELAELEQVIAEAKSGELEAAERKLAAAEAKARDAEAKAAARAAAPEKKGPGWLKALVTLQETNESPDKAEAVESRLAGDYDGWTGRTTFKLENGQIWQQTDGKQRYDDRRPAPAVKIYPGMLGVFWLEIEGVRERVKVKPIRLQ